MAGLEAALAAAQEREGVQARELAEARMSVRDAKEALSKSEVRGRVWADARPRARSLPGC